MGTASNEINEYRVQVVRLASGRNHPVLLCDGRPMIYPNLWVNDVAGTRRFNTASAYLQDLIPLYQWADSKGIVLFERFESLKSLTGVEIQLLVRALSKRKGSDRLVSWSTCQRRLFTLRQFLGWLFDYFLDPLAFGNEVALYNGQKRKDRLDVRLKRASDTVEMSHTAQMTQALSIDALRRLSDALNPLNANGPFRRLPIIFRNYVIFHVLVETWARRAEVVLLEISDLDLGVNPTITIRRGSESNQAKRKDGASLKTIGRVAPISDGLAQILQTYLDVAREDLRRPRTPTRAVFLSEKDGHRLSTKSINDMFYKTINFLDAQGGEKIRLHPHALRHTAATTFRDQQPTGGGILAEAEIRDIMVYMGGWTPNSVMPSHYSRAALQKRVGQAVRKGIL